MTGPRILYCAPFLHSWGTEEHVARDAEAIGCEVIRAGERNFVDAMMRATDVDLVLYTRGVESEHRRVTDWWVERYADDGFKTASLSLDLYRGLARESEVGRNPFWTTGRVFTPDDAPEWFTERGVKHSHLWPACVSDEVIEVDTNEYPIQDYPAEIVFLGSTRAYHPEHPWRLEMIAGLRKRYGERFAAFGPQEGNIVRGLEMNALFQSNNRIVVGDSLNLPGNRSYTSDRIFESLGRGAALVYPFIPGLDALGFHDRDTLRYYDVGDLPYLFDVIDELLDNPDEARAMAQRGRALVASAHTYRHRVREILDVLEIPHD